MKVYPVHRLFWFEKDERFEREKKRAEKIRNNLFTSSSNEHIADDRYNDLRSKKNNSQNHMAILISKDEQ